MARARRRKGQSRPRPPRKQETSLGSSDHSVFTEPPIQRVDSGDAAKLLREKLRAVLERLMNQPPPPTREPPDNVDTRAA